MTINTWELSFGVYPYIILPTHSEKEPISPLTVMPILPLWGD